MSVTETSENDCSLHKNHTFTRLIKKHTHYFHMLSVKVVVYSIQSETQSK